MPAGRLLVIDDDDAIAGVMAAVLGADGYSVERVSRPQAALALLATRDADAWRLVLSDSFARSGGNPYVWLDRLRTRTRAPIVICSGWPAARYADYRARGYAACLTKPFDLHDLLALVASLCRIPGQ